MRRLVRILGCAAFLACSGGGARRAEKVGDAGSDGGVPETGGTSGFAGGDAAAGAAGSVVDAVVEVSPDDASPGPEAGAGGGPALRDDFEDVAVGGPPDPARWTVGAPDVTGGGTLAIDEAQHHSGARSVKVAGQGGYTNHIFLSNREALARLGSSVWGRFYLRLSDPLGDGHVTFLAMKDAADGGKHLRMGGQAQVLMWNRESDDATLPALSPTGRSLSRVLPARQWLCVELLVDEAAGALRTWLDGVEVPGLLVDESSTPDVDEQWHRRPSWRPSLVDFALGWESYGGQAMTLWFDDVVLADARVGCDP